MAERLTRYPSGLELEMGIALELQTSEPSGVLFSDGVSYATRITAGGTYGMFWLESNGIHYNTNGTERVVPLTSTSGTNSLDVAYDVGGTITVDGGAVTLADPTTGATDTLALSKSSTNTGNAISVDLDAAVGARALSVDAGAGARTQELVYVKLDGTFSSAAGGTFLDLDVTQTGASASDLFDIDVSSIYTGDIFNIALSAAATGTVFNADMDAAVASVFMNIDAGAGTRTSDLITVTFDGDGDVSVLDITATNTGSGNLIDITVDAIHTGNALSIVYGTAAATGDAINIDMGTAVGGGALVIAGSGARTDSLIDIADASTGNVAMIKAAVSGNFTGNLVELSCNTGTATGNVIDIDMDTNVAGYALYVDFGAGSRTSAAIGAKADGAGNVGVLEIANTNTGSGNMIDIEANSTGSGNMLNIGFVTAAHTGHAINLDMDTNVTGIALLIDSSATGTAAEGSAIHVVHDGNLAANADLMRLVSSGSHNAASNLLYIEGSGASAAGTYAVNINASGTNIEALKVDAGGVVFDETLAVAGATTLTGLVTCAAGLRTSAVARTTTATGETTGQIAAGTSFVDLTCGGATEVVGLPQGALGDIIIIKANTSIGFEIRPKVADKATTTMNGGDCSSDEEIAIGAGDMARCICTKGGAAGNWTVSSIDADGGITAGGTPN